MVVRRTKIVDQFLPGERPTVQQQTQGRDQPPPAARTWKRQCTTDQPPRRPEETPPRIPLASTPVVAVTRESAYSVHPPKQVGSNVASSSSLTAVLVGVQRAPTTTLDPVHYHLYSLLPSSKTFIAFSHHRLLVF
ncbi:hypothetical protein CMV_019448 [Castanea mollissima]|uniref:Uncharacterized protein n=1 Tax=Castanea mollissima TaxID=60419 RepID=A0A8J4QPU2_9ROSI|nr:hypothetical protein CMV_019448 [Castanea mollissima]